MVRNLKDLMKKFADETVCREHLISMRWPDGNVTCQYCGHKKCYRIENGDRFKCANNKCYKRFRVTVGTVFESSNIPLSTWFPAAYLILNHKKGISSCQLARDLGVTQKTAWFMLHRIREQLKANNSPMLTGTVEIDETFVGGIVGNMHKSKRAALRTAAGGTIQNKTMVVGMLAREGNLKLVAVGKETGRDIVQPLVRNNVNRDAMLITDASHNYDNLNNEYAGHEVVNHSENEYVKPNGIHTNSIEGAFSMLKRSIIGVYHHVTSKHLTRYCDETSFRYNTRKITDPQRFDLSLTMLEGRLRYRDLIQDVEPIQKPEPFQPEYRVKHPVLQMQDGVIINQFKTVSEASQQTGISYSLIYKCVKVEKKTSHGYQWKYA